MKQSETLGCDFSHGDYRGCLTSQANYAYRRYPMNHLPLPADEVHLWYGTPEELLAGEMEVVARAILSNAENARLKRYLFLEDKASFLATRVLIRTVLSRYRARKPVEWRFSVGAHGRPEIEGGNTPRLRFNLSHTDRLVACAVVRDVDVGVDVERIRDGAHSRIADRFFSPLEREALHRTSAVEQVRRFYDYWTLKESYIKAKGIGLSLPLDAFGFVLEPTRAPRIEIDPALGDDASLWQFIQIHPTREHVLSLCIRRVGDSSALPLRLQSRTLRQFKVDRVVGREILWGMGNVSLPND